MRPKSANRDLPPRMLRRTRVLKNGKDGKRIITMAVMILVNESRSR